MIDNLKKFTDHGEPFVIMSVGIPGSGKSTVMNEISEALNVPVLGTDGIRQEITGNLADVSQDALIPDIMRKSSRLYSAQVDWLS